MTSGSPIQRDAASELLPPKREALRPPTIRF
jgi:hypothetical protein